MRSSILTTVILSFSVLSACQNTVAIDIETSPFYNIPAGSTVTLNQEMTFPPDEVSIYLFNGNVVPRATIDIYKPHCKFELYNMQPMAQTITPDTFTIRKIVDFNVQNMPSGRRYASFAVSRFATSSPSYQPYTTYMYLHSDKQPNVYRLSCRHWEDPVDARYLTVSQIRQTLGTLMTLKLNDPRAKPTEPGQRS